MLTNASATVYNYWRSAVTGVEYWSRTYLDRVHWQEASELIATGDGAIRGTILRGLTNVFIPVRVATDDDKRYLPPENYDALDEEQVLAGNYWTLQEEKDFIVRGRCLVEPSELVQSVRALPSAVRLQVVKFNLFGSMGMQHWMLTGM